MYYVVPDDNEQLINSILYIDPKLQPLTPLKPLPHPKKIPKKHIINNG